MYLNINAVVFSKVSGINYVLNSYFTVRYSEDSRTVILILETATV